jgi:hypothetical protein
VADLQQIVAQWQTAYRSYTDAHEANRYVPVGDLKAAARIAPAYRRVALVWRQLASQDTTPWWAKAAALHAAEVFDHQADLSDQVAGGQAVGAHHLYRPVSGKDSGDGSAEEA